MSRPGLRRAGFRLGRPEGGHDLGGHLDHPAALAAGLTAQALKRLPLAQAFLGDQRPLGLLDHHPGLQGPLQLGGQLPPLLALHGQPAQPLAIGILRLHRRHSIAAALRRNARDATRVLPLLGITSP